MLITDLYANDIRIFDYPQFAEPLNEEIRENAERIAKENGIQIEFIRKTGAFRKDDRIKEIIKNRGEEPGKELGLCYLRVPTWCPFRLQFYMNILKASRIKTSANLFQKRVLLQFPGLLKGFMSTD